MATCSLQTLLTDANSNLFTSVGETTQRALLLQLLCQLATEGVGTDSYTLHASADGTAAAILELTTYYFGYNASKQVQIINTVGRMRP